MKNILLVTGNAETTATVSRMLLSRGYGLITVSTAALALSVVRRGGGVDAVIADYVLPDMDVRAFFSSLKKASPVQLPVILMNDRVDIQDYLNILTQGAFDFLFNPIEPGELSRVLKLALGNRKERNPDALSAHFFGRAHETELRAAAGFQ